MLLVVEILFMGVLVAMLLVIYKSDMSLSRDAPPRARLEGYWDGRERRRRVRFKKTLDVKYAVEKRPHLKGCRAVDISDAGIQIMLDEKLAEGALIDLKIELPEPKRTVEVEGRVIWSREADENAASDKRMFRAGIKFYAIKEPQAAPHFADYLGSLYDEADSQKSPREDG